MIIGSATVEDVQAIVSIFVSNRSDPGLFQESEAGVRRNLGDFLVARDANGRVVACSGLHRDSAELAEVYGVAVLPELQGQGIGAMLMQKCKERAFASQLTCLWLATVKPEYFRRYSFCTISRWSLPTSVLLRKFRQVFEQPVQRWVPVLFGRHTFIEVRFAGKGKLLVMRIKVLFLELSATLPLSDYGRVARNSRGGELQHSSALCESA